MAAGRGALRASHAVNVVKWDESSQNTNLPIPWVAAPVTFADSAVDVASLDGAILELPPHSMTVMRISETYLDWHENEFLFSRRQ